MENVTTFCVRKGEGGQKITKDKEHFETFNKHLKTIFYALYALHHLLRLPSSDLVYFYRFSTAKLKTFSGGFLSFCIEYLNWYNNCGPLGVRCTRLRTCSFSLSLLYSSLLLGNCPHHPLGYCSQLLLRLHLISIKININFYIKYQYRKRTFI